MHGTGDSGQNIQSVIKPCEYILFIRLLGAGSFWLSGWPLLWTLALLPSCSLPDSVASMLQSVAFCVGDVCVQSYKIFFSRCYLIVSQCIYSPPSVKLQLAKYTVAYKWIIKMFRILWSHTVAWTRTQRDQNLAAESIFKETQKHRSCSNFRFLCSSFTQIQTI